MKFAGWTGLGLLGFACMLHALEAPQLGIAARIDGDSLRIDLDWNEVDGATVYRLHRRGDEALLLETTGTAALLSFPADSDLPENLTGLFHVVAAGSQATLSMVRVPAGSFLQGEETVANASPEHSTTLTRDVLLGAQPVTNQQYLEALQWAIEHAPSTGVAVEGDYVTAYGRHLVELGSDGCELVWLGAEFGLRPSPEDDAVEAYPSGYDPATHPVKRVTWYGAACYCDWLSEMEGFAPFYLGDWSHTPTHDPYAAEGYRLPMEAEWEHAAQWDDDRFYPWGDGTPNCSLLNYFSPLGYCIGWTTPVGSYGQTALGFHDMAGNVREWCGDVWGGYDLDPTTDPLGPLSGSYRVLRGCGWSWNGDHASCAYRSRKFPSYGDDYIGLRVARSLPVD